MYEPLLCLSSLLQDELMGDETLDELQGTHHVHI